MCVRKRREKREKHVWKCPYCAHKFMILFYLHFISLKYVYWVWSRIHLVRNLLCDFKKRMFHIVWMSVELMKFWCTTSAILSQSSDMVSVAWTASVPFTTPLSWHSKVSTGCTLQNLTRSSTTPVYFLPAALWILWLWLYYDSHTVFLLYGSRHIRTLVSSCIFKAHLSKKAQSVLIGQ